MTKLYTCHKFTHISPRPVSLRFLYDQHFQTRYLTMSAMKQSFWTNYCKNNGFPPKHHNDCSQKGKKMGRTSPSTASTLLTHHRQMLAGLCLRTLQSPSSGPRTLDSLLCHCGMAAAVKKGLQSPPCFL